MWDCPDTLTLVKTPVTPVTTPVTPVTGGVEGGGGSHPEAAERSEGGQCRVGPSSGGGASQGRGAGCCRPGAAARSSSGGPLGGGCSRKRCGGGVGKGERGASRPHPAAPVDSSSTSPSGLFCWKKLLFEVFGGFQAKPVQGLPCRLLVRASACLVFALFLSFPNLLLSYVSLRSFPELFFIFFGSFLYSFIYFFISLALRTFWPLSIFSPPLSVETTLPFVSSPLGKSLPLAPTCIIPEKNDPILCEFYS